MTNRDILNALGDLDESYITEANGRIKSKKGIIIRYSAMAACLLIVGVGAFAAVKLIPRGKMKNSGDREGSNGGGGIYRRARDCGEHSGEHCYKYRYRDNVH